MKKFCTLLILLYCSGAIAQQYNNEWIDYKKTYYKFRTNRTGLMRIPQATLASIGWGATPVQQFKLWRNGQELPLYTTVATGALPANGYIEFWAQANDGKADKALYRDPNYQHTDKLSLQTDTAAYFLTVDPVAANLRYNDAPNNVAANVLPAEPYFMYTTGTYFQENINPGFAAVIGENVYSSSYDKGEFLSTLDIRPASPRTDRQQNLNAYTTGPGAQLKFGAVGNALNTRTVQVLVNGTLIKDTVCDYFNDVIGTAQVPVSQLSSGTADFSFANTSTVTADRMVVSFYELTYPRKFDFGGAANFTFTLPSSVTGYFLQIANFNAGSSTPVLYDMNTLQRYPGDISTPGTVKFALPAAPERRLVLVNEDAANIVSVGASDLTQRIFTDLTNTSNQGDYLIISHPQLYTSSSGSNPVNDYKLYRASAIGGGFNPVIYDIDELVDQFAFGIKKHPLSVKNFTRYARATFAQKPAFVLLVGHGVAYNAYRKNITSPLADKLNIVPTFGWPASDNLLASPDGATPIPSTPIGRISAVSGDEVANYLQKVMEYESAQKNSPNTIAGRAWMKEVMEITGASEAYLGSVLCDYMQTYKQIITDTLVGANVSIFCKNTSDEVENVSNEKVMQRFNDGFSLFCYFGHSSSTVLEFNIADPFAFSNQGKYPVFSVNGCLAGDFFVFDANRFSFSQTLSEKFTLAKQRGSIAFLASTHYGIVNYLNIFINSLYTMIGKDDYGASLGQINKDAAQRMLNIAGANDYHARLHAEEMTLHGDPAIKMNFQPLPDYVIEEPQVVIKPTFVSIAETNFTASIHIYNIGKATKDSFVVEVKQQYPDNSTATLFRKKIPAIAFLDSLVLKVPIVATRDKGLNKLFIKLDADNAITEVSETNNAVTKEFYIYEDEARPAFPYNYAIVNKSPVKLLASTANPLAQQRQYIVEIDTTELFNSSIKQSKTITSVGGLIEFTPSAALLDSTVYYWRVAIVPTNNDPIHWNNSSFVYLPSSSEGFNQSHYFQHLKSDMTKLFLGTDRTWTYSTLINNVFLRNGTFPTSSGSQSDFEGNINANTVLGAGCFYDELIFQVMAPGTFHLWQNDFSGPTGKYSSLRSVCGAHRTYNFEYLLGTSASRKLIMDFIDSIPAGAYVVMRTNTNPNNAGNTYSSVWASDTTLFGSGNSLYHKLLNQGFTTIDSFYKARSFIFLFKKDGKNEFTPKSVFSQGVFDGISASVDCPVPDTIGFITSPVFGPAKAWKKLHWRGTSVETPSNDNPTIDIIGVDPGGNESVLYTVDQTLQDFDISNVSAAQYPNIKLKMRNIDSVTQSPYQLRYWRLDYDPVPEGALIPNIYFKTKKPSALIDTLDIGEKLNFGIAFKNISNAAFDSLRIKMYVLDQSNVAHVINLPNKKPLISGDSVQIDYSIDTRDYVGMNTLYIDFNPDNAQPEQYHFNNFMFRNFYVRGDRTNPLLDVTFDNIHILNRDIVSARPHIQIKLKDEAKYMLLSDTADMIVQVKFPDNTIKSYRFNTDTLRFTPAVSGSDNTATVDFFPSFLKQISQDGDEYQLIVKGKDASGNKAGSSDYSVNFRVISKPMISNLLNYPNPFTTSTAFVFTITGSDIPDNMKIQILTVTGKVVREITKQELGPLHIGRNITDYKWDGNDQYGQRLANGVYLYRFVTTMNGKKMDKFTDTNDNTDQFFTRGYGKMYLMR